MDNSNQKKHQVFLLEFSGAEKLLPVNLSSYWYNLEPAGSTYVPYLLSAEAENQMDLTSVFATFSGLGGDVKYTQLSVLFDDRDALNPEFQLQVQDLNGELLWHSDILSFVDFYSSGVFEEDDGYFRDDVLEVLWDSQYGEGKDVSWESLSPKVRRTLEDHVQSYLSKYVRFDSEFASLFAKTFFMVSLPLYEQYLFAVDNRDYSWPRKIDIMPAMHDALYARDDGPALH